ncbi:MAG: GAF domain-containing protein, partial [Anaerolineales bacterium]|nr:GAF domain-containing protein [Anaerolineales bacterium]
TTTDRILFISLYFALLMVTILRVNYSIRAFALLFMVFTIGVNSILAWGPWLDASAFFIAFIILSALLFDQRVDIIALITSISTFALIAALQQSGIYQFRAPNVPVTTLIDWVTYTIDFSIISAILIIAINQLKGGFAHVVQGVQNTFKMLTTERAQLEDRVRERTDELETRDIQLRSSATISKTIAEIQDISELMETTTRLTSDQFGYYHVGLYLLDERKKTAFLQSTSSVTGKQLVGQGFRIEPDRHNLFNLVVQYNRPYITSDMDNVNFVRDVNFPLTRSRMMLPLTVRSNIIGILDMHSDQSQSFNSQDAEVLQTLADLVAISIDNVRLINDTKKLVRQLETNTSVQTREIWAKFTSRHKPAYQYTPAGVRPLFVNNTQDNLDGLRVPLILHGQTIGNIILKRKGATTTWSERERTLVEKVANQVALALENSRLVDETQKNAVRDQVIANVSARVRETLDVESVLRTATTELRRVFDLKEAEISIGALQTENTPVKKHTSSLRLK